MSPERQEEVREVKMREKRSENEPNKEKGNSVEENEESTFIIISLFPDKPTTFFNDSNACVNARVSSYNFNW